MAKVKATKPKIKPPIEISDDKLLSTSSSLPSSPCLSRRNVEIKEEVDKLSLAYIRKNKRKRNYSLLFSKKENQN